MNFADNIDSITAHIRTNKSPIAKERWSSKAHEIGDLVLRLQSNYFMIKLIVYSRFFIKNFKVKFNIRVNVLELLKFCYRVLLYTIRRRNSYELDA